MAAASKQPCREILLCAIPLLVVLSFAFTFLSLSASISVHVSTMYHNQYRMNIIHDELDLPKYSSILKTPEEPHNFGGIGLGPTSRDTAENNSKEITVLAVGDILALNRYSKQWRRTGNFTHIWSPVEHYIRSADIACGNFEGVSSNITVNGEEINFTLQSSNNLYTFSKEEGFNYPERMIADLRKVGFDVMSVANNHCMDRGVNGIRQTIVRLEKAGIVPTGARNQPYDPGNPRDFVRFTYRKGWKIAWISCTTFVNHLMLRRFNISPEQHFRHVLLCENAPNVIREVKNKLKADAILLRVHQGPEWGTKHTRRMENRSLAMLEAGASAVFGGHSHMVQGIQRHRTKDGRDTFIAYSLGSFAAGMGFSSRNKPVYLLSRSSALLYATIVKSEDYSGNLVAQIKDVFYIPTCEWFGTDRLVRVWTTDQLNGLCNREQRIVERTLGKPVESVPRSL